MLALVIRNIIDAGFKCSPLKHDSANRRRSETVHVTERPKSSSTTETCCHLQGRQDTAKQKIYNAMNLHGLGLQMVFC